MAKAIMILLASTLLTECSSSHVREAPGWIDHVVIGVADLETGTREFAALTGVQPVVGGRHPGRGTQNALVSLGGHAYLEIIAPLSGAVPSDDLRMLATLPHLHPIDFAVSAGNEQRLRDGIGASGLHAGEARPGSRETPAGTTLRWVTFGLSEEVAGTPFFIVWGEGTPHPSSTSPQGCTLAGLSLATPDDGKMTALRNSLGIPLDVLPGPTPALQVRLRCPKGTVTLPVP